MRLLVITLLLAFASASPASIEAYEFETAEMEADYNQLVNELRCLVCQNQNLAGSDADLARDLRRQTYEMLIAGKSSDQVVEFMIARYGDFVLYRPQFQLNTYLLWLGPFVLLVVVLIVLVRRLRGAAVGKIASDESMSKAEQLLSQQESDQ
ncbi:MAG: cytochrome c-type biogenesis protein CcmH [Planctomycetota bacterium]|jgi:cytochrome c-type biogenesis protein CcmH